jgi:hypothetical protein
MPLKGFTCPPQVPTAGTRNDTTWCISKCPHPCAAPPLLAAILAAESTNHHKGAYISASMIAGNSCPRALVYERTYDFWELPHKRYWSFRGSHAHSMIEGAAPSVAPYGWLQELHMATQVTYNDLPAPILDADDNFTGKYDDTQPLVITVGGTCDAYNPKLPDYPMWDFKSMADMKADMFIRGSKGGTFSPHLEDRWVWQLNIYRYLLSKTEIPKEVKKALKLKTKYYPTPKFLGIQGISMMSIPRTGQAYPLRTGYNTELKDIDDIPLLEMAEVEQYIKTRALEWYRWLVLGHETPVVPADLKWMCKGCVFNGEIIPGERCNPTQERKQQSKPVDDLELEV